MRRWGVVLLVLVMAACSGGTAQPTPALVSITQGVATCGDVIQAGAQHPYCDGVDVVCYAVATYNADNPAENVVERGVAGPLARLRDTDVRVGRQLDDIPNATRWQSVAVYTQDTVLMTLDGATLAGISADLDGLRLTTETTTPACDDGPTAGLLVQTARSEIVLIVNGARITVTGTTLLRERDGALLVYALDGVTVVAAARVSRIVRAGEQTSMASGPDGLEAPRPAVAYDAVLLTGLPLVGLPQPIRVQPTRDVANPPTATACSVRADWTGTYTIQRGDTLVTLAPRFGLEPDTLRAGNCIPNPNRLQVGAVLRVPAGATPTTTAPALPTLPSSTDAAPALPTLPPFTDAAPILPTLAPSTDAAPILPTLPPATSATPLPPPTPTPAPFTADDSEITPGGCTTLRWSLVGAVAAELDGKGVATSGERQVCPALTTVYTLRARYPDGTVETVNRAVAVRRP